MKINLPPPVVVGEAVLGDFSGLDHLSKSYGEGDLLDVMLYPNNTAMAGKRFAGYENPMHYGDVVDAIATFIRPVRQQLLDVGDPIQVTYDFNAVAPYEAQRFPQWHTDASIGSRGLGIMVSDTFPTEFAHGTLKGGDRRAYLASNPLEVLSEADGKINRVVTRLINDKKLVTSAPNPLEVARFTAATLHRSPHNTFSEPTPRRFLRVRTLAA